MKETTKINLRNHAISDQNKNETTGNKSASVTGYVADLEAFMVAVSSKLKCLPSFADPHPDEGNEHVIRKLDELLKRAT